MNKGHLAVFTGNGKGKTTSALGLAFRALGHGHKVCVIQFIKGSWLCGEQILAQSLAPQLDFHVMGKGFTWKSDNLAEDAALARKAWDFAVRTIDENRHQLVILDELTYLVRYEMIPEQEIIEALGRRPDGMHVVVTGRHASQGLIEAADLVTEMGAVKHPYDLGIAAQKGFEY